VDGCFETSKNTNNGNAQLLYAQVAFCADLQHVLVMLTLVLRLQVINL